MGPDPKSRFAAGQPPASVRLNSWKQIAAYLDRDPRTAQLWEKQEGLPVHRLNHHARASVYAYTGEIDAWLQARSPQATTGAIKDAQVGLQPTPNLRPHARRIDWFAAFAFAALLPVLLWIANRRKAPLLPTASTLAVLPFENQISTNDFFVDGLTDGLIDDLGRIGKIQVIARPSVLQFEGRRPSVRQIAAKLHASLVLEGAVAQAGNQVQVTVELLDAAKDARLWGAAYKGKTGDLLSFQDEVASEIAIAVTRQVTGTVPQTVFPPGAVDLRATQAFLTGRFYWSQRDLPSVNKAISYFGQAISIDPRYAPAYAGLAESYDLMPGRGVLSDAQDFRDAKAAAQIALSLDPSSAAAYSALGAATYRQDWDFARAEQYFQKAVALNPDYAVAHQWYGQLLGDLGRSDQSIAELRKAKELDPLAPMVSSDLANAYLGAGRFDEADAELQRVLGLYPDFAPAHEYRIGLYLRKGDLAAAETEARVYLQQTGDKTPWQTIEVERLVAAGNQDRARAEVRRLLTGANAPAFDSYRTAQLYFAAGQKEAGYRALEQAYRERSWRLVAMLADPGFDPVRNEPRFLDLARRVGLPAAVSSLATEDRSPSF